MQTQTSVDTASTENTFAIVFAILLAALMFVGAFKYPLYMSNKGGVPYSNQPLPSTSTHPVDIAKQLKEFQKQQRQLGASQ